MQQIQWSLAPDSSSANFKIRVEDTLDPDAPWVFFFTGVNPVDYPRVIEAAVQEIGVGFNAVGVNFPGDLDELDLVENVNLTAGNVEVYHHDFGSTIMPRTVFYTILCAFAKRLLENADQSAIWHKAMAVALEKLDVKIASDTDSRV